MQVKLLAFAQARDQLGWPERMVECSADETPRTVLARVAPELRADFMRVAVDQEYHEWDAPIGMATEIALIPPVSGG
jgi:molybdopterin synthase sulfur carrier subunit